MPIITLNGNITYEPCPICGETMKVEHGHDEHGFRHVEYCPVCGISTPIVCYDCPHCKPMENVLINVRTHGGLVTIHRTMNDLLRDIQYLLQDIQGAGEGCMGSLGDTYLPQLKVERIDELAVRVSTYSVQDIDRAARAQE